MNINEKLKKLRQNMKAQNLQGLLVTTGDPHQSEYLSDHYKTREYISGFTGSNGTVFISQNTAYIWTDGRYYIQCQKEIASSEFQMKKMGEENELTIDQCINQELRENDSLGIDLEYYSHKDYLNLKKKLQKKSISIVHSKLLEDMWDEQPPLPRKQAFELSIDYSGQSREEKIRKIQEILHEKGADSTFISSLEDIAWVLNIRGRDIPNNPVVISYLFISDSKILLFTHLEKIPKSLQIPLEKSHIELIDYDRVFDCLGDLKNYKLYIDPKRNSHRVVEILQENNNVIFGKEVSASLKSVKNPVEISNLEEAYLQDGIALTKFICKLKNHSYKDDLGEYDAAKILENLRKERTGYIEDSFETISAYGPNAAMMHYSANKENQTILQASGLLLVDSGGQYLFGTTDTTRTIALGQITPEERHDFTLVLKSSLALLSLVFLKGCRDSDLDIIARAPIWKEAKDYKCGTGHGVGYLLSVHEGPPRLAFSYAEPTVLQLGQMFTIEPGIYRENKYGIRTENTVIVKEEAHGEDGIFYSLKNLTRVPIDLEAIDINMLSEEEKSLLNQYHYLVYESLSPYMEDHENAWLKQATRKI